MKTSIVTVFLITLISSCNILQDTDSTSGGVDNRCGVGSTMDVLFIGESEIEESEVPQNVLSMGCRKGLRMSVTVFAPEGYSIADHAVDNNLASLIQSKSWEYVFISESSQLSLDAGYDHVVNTAPPLESLKAIILNSYPASKIMLVENWSREESFVSDNLVIQNKYSELGLATGTELVKLNQLWEEVYSDNTKQFLNSELWLNDGVQPSKLGSLLISGLVMTHLTELDLTSEYFTRMSARNLYLLSKINEFRYY